MTPEKQSTELTRKDESTTNGAVAAVPDEAQLPARFAGTEELEPGDLTLPQMRVAQAVSVAVQDEIVQVGAIYVASEPNDPAPKVIYEPGQKGTVIHVLGHRKSWVFHDSEDRFTVTGRSAGALVGPVRDAQPAYELAILAPSFDAELPCSWLLKGSAMSAAKRIFTSAAKEKAELWRLEWSLTTAERRNEKGRWWSPVVAPIAKPKVEYVKAAACAAELLGAPGGNA
jgi:hypothetical protein